MRTCCQEESLRELGIFHFLSKLWVQKALTGRATKGMTRPRKAGQVVSKDTRVSKEQ